MFMRKKIVSTSFGVLAIAALSLLQQAQAAAPLPQQASESVADAARRNREEKKTQKPAARVYTDDDIANLKGTVSVVGPPPPAPPPAADAKTTDAAATDKTPPAPAVKDEAYWRKAFADARKKQADDAKELDILQREFNLKQQQYYTDPNVAMHEQNTRKDLNDTQAQIDAKTADVAKDKQAISDLQDGLRNAGGDAGWSREP
jgi:hypothetical protein